MPPSFKRIFNTSSAPVIVLDTTGKILYVNDEFERRSGYRCADIRGSSRMPFFTAGARNEFRNMVRVAFRKNRMETCATPMSCADGTVVQFLWHTLLVQDKPDDKAGAIAVFGAVEKAREHAGKEIEELEERYRIIFENSGVGMAFIREDSVIALMNRELEKITGYPRSAIEGKMRWTDFVIDAGDLERMTGYHRQRRIDPDGVPSSYDLKVRMANGDIRDVLFHVAMIPGTTYSLASVIDITERKRSEDILRRSEEQYRTLVDNMQDTLYRCDIEGNLTYISPSAKRLLTTASAQDLIGMNIANDLYFNPADRKLFLERLQRDGSVANHELKLKRRDGSIIHIVTNSHLYYDGDGKLLGVEGVFRDITEQKIAEAALRESEEKYRALVDNMQEALYRADIDGNLSFISPSGAHILRYETPDDMIGMNIADEFYVDPGQRASLLDEIRKHGKVTNYELHLKRRDGTAFIAIASSHFLYDRNGVLQGVEGVFTDITDLKLAEEEVRRSRKLMNDILQAASEFSIVAADPQGIIMTFNRGSELMLGYSADEIVGKRSPLLYVDSAEVARRSEELTDELGYPVEGFRVFVARAELTGAETRTWTFVRKDGSRLNASLVVTAMRSDTGEITGYVGIANDITLRKKMEEEARMLASVVHHSGEMVSLARPGGRMVFLNEAGSRMLGIDPKDVGKINIMQVIPDHLKGVILNEMLPRLLEGKTWEGELQYRNLRTGELTDVHALAFSIDDPEAGSHKYLANVSLDITRRKRAEEETRQAEDKFSRIFMLSPEAIALTRLSDGMIVDVNIGFEKIMGLERQEAIGKTSREINFWADPSDRETMVEDLKAGRDVRDRAFRFKRKDGVVRDGVYSARTIRIFGADHLIFILNDVTERSETERMMRQKDERLRGITENIPGIVFQFYAKDNGEWGTSYVGERMTEMFGIEADAGEVFAAFSSGVYEADRERFYDSIQKAVETTSSWNFEGRYLKPSGQMMWFHGLSSPTRYHDRLVFDGLILNISERKYAEEMSRQAEDRFTKVFMTSPDCIAITHLEDGQIIEVNPGFEEILGWKWDEVLGRTTLDLNIWIDPGERIRMVEDLKSGRDVLYRETRFRRKDGALRDVTYSARVINVAGNECVMFLLQDITDRKLAEEALRHSEQLFRSIVENANDVIYIITPQGNISYMSPAFTEVMGEPADTTLGRKINTYIHPDDIDMVMDYIIQLLQTGETLRNIEFRAIRSDGSILWASVITSALRDAEGNITGLMGIARNITEQKRTEEVLRSSLEEKEVLLKELYHRTKNNMQVICGLLKLESFRTENTAFQGVLTDIENRIQAMSLVHQKLYESKDLTNINLSEFVRSLSGLIVKNYALPEGNVSISQDVESIPLSIDTIMPLGLVMTELITNSIKHAFTGGKKGAIGIEMKMKDGNLLLDYRDDGTGLTDGFDPAATKTLGMNIIRNIVTKQLGGDIRFYTENGLRCSITMRTNLYRRRV